MELDHSRTQREPSYHNPPWLQILMNQIAEGYNKIGDGCKEMGEKIEEGYKEMGEKLEEGYKETGEMMEDLLNKLEEGQKKWEEGQKKLEEGQNKLEEGQNKLEEGQNKLEEGQRRIIQLMDNMFQENIGEKETGKEEQNIKDNPVRTEGKINTFENISKMHQEEDTPTTETEVEDPQEDREEPSEVVREKEVPNQLTQPLEETIANEVPEDSVVTTIQIQHGEEKTEVEEEEKMMVEATPTTETSNEEVKQKPQDNNQPRIGRNVENQRSNRGGKRKSTIGGRRRRETTYWHERVQPPHRRKRMKGKKSLPTLRGKIRRSPDQVEDKMIKLNEGKLGDLKTRLKFHGFGPP